MGMSATDSRQPETVDILVVCTANRARSPAAAHLLAAEAQRRKVNGAARVVSAGLDVAEWHGMLRTMSDAMTARGLHLEGHVASALQVDTALSSRLVVAMTEEQRRRVALLDPSLVARCFALRELVRLVSSSFWRPEWNGAWDGERDVAGHLHAIRPLVLPARRPEDIADPREGGHRMARVVLADIVAAVESIAEPLFGPVVA
jgi:protein-tyrosine phosphatase